MTRTAETAWHELTVDRDGELPLGTQLTWKLRALIASGQAPAGDQLPPVRELAESAAVNVNTIRAVYARLEDDGYVVTEHGRGTFVSHPAPAAIELERIAGEALSEAHAASVDPRDLAASIYSSVATGSGEGGKGPGVPVVEDGDERLARRELRRQIARLERELSEYPPSGREPTGRNFGAYLPSTEDLEAVRDRLLGELERAKGAEGERQDRRGEARRRLEQMILQPGRHRFRAVSGADLGEPGCKRYWSTPRLGPIGMLMGWWRVKLSSGCPLAGAGRQNRVEPARCP